MNALWHNRQYFQHFAMFSLKLQIIEESVYSKKLVSCIYFYGPVSKVLTYQPDIFQESINGLREFIFSTLASLLFFLLPPSLLDVLVSPHPSPQFLLTVLPFVWPWPLPSPCLLSWGRPWCPDCRCCMQSDQHWPLIEEQCLWLGLHRHRTFTTNNMAALVKEWFGVRQ